MHRLLVLAALFMAGCADPEFAAPDASTPPAAPAALASPAAPESVVTFPLQWHFTYDFSTQERRAIREAAERWNLIGERRMGLALFAETESDGIPIGAVASTSVTPRDGASVPYGWDEGRAGAARITLVTDLIMRDFASTYKWRVLQVTEHEMGHALGLVHSVQPDSIVSNSTKLSNYATSPSVGDEENLCAIWGCN